MKISSFLGLAVSFGFVFTAALSARADYATEVLADNPAGYWRLGDNAPVPTVDVVVNRGSLASVANGEYVGKPATAQPGALVGSANTAVNFTGQRYAYVPYQAELNPAPPFTVELWVKPNSLQTAANVVSPLASLRRASPAAEGWIFYQSATGWNYRQGDSANNYTVDLTAVTAIDTNRWYHLAATYDGSTAILYLDGVEAARKANETRYTPNYQVNLGIGARGDNSFWFDGLVDEVAIYSKLLSPTQIAARYANGTNATPTPAYDQLVLGDGPLAYWRLDEAALPPWPVAKNTGSLGDPANGSYINGAFGGHPGALAGDANLAAGFDGVNDKIDVAFNADLNRNGSFSIECWAKVMGNAGQHRSPLSSRDDNPARGYIFYATPGDTWEFWTGDGSPWHVVAGPTLYEGEWYHLVGTYDGSNKLFYVNGELVGAASRVTPPLINPNAARPLRIGAGATEGPGNYFFNGNVDEVAVYTSVLSPARVYSHYKTGKGAEPVPVGPTVFQEPQTQTVFVNRSVTFTVISLGSLPFQYQWKFNGANIPGATGASHTIASAQTTDSGDYTVEITNAGGTVMSAAATLTVLNITVPDIVQPPQNVTVYAGGTGNFSVTATGSPNLTYQWQFNGTDLVGATNATLAVVNAQAANQGNYAVKVTSEAGTTTSSAATLTVIVPPANSYPAVVMADQPAAFWRLGESTGTKALDYAGGFNGDYIDGILLGQSGALKDDPSTAVSFDGFTGKVEVPWAAGLNTPQFTIECWAKVTGGAGVHRSPLTARADFPQRGFIFYATPGDVWEFWTGQGDSSGWQIIGGPAVAYNEWAYLVATYDGTTKRFYVNGSLVGSSAGAYGVNADRPLRIGAGATDDPVGNFWFSGEVDEVAVYPTALAPERVALHYAAAFGASTPPTISQQPAPRAVLPGADVSFSVGVAGSLPLTYQWQKDGADVADGTNATLTLTGVTASAVGNYRVVVRNLAGTATSDPARLDVVVTPDIPYRQLIIGDGPVAYWRLNETTGDWAEDQVAANDGMYLNGVLLGISGAVAGDPDPAAQFSAANQTKVEVPFSPDLNPPVFTAEVWAKVTGGSGHRSPLTSRGDSPQRGYIFYAEPGNTWQFWTGTGQQVGWNSLQGPAVSLNSWTHLVGTYDGTTKRFYVNGVEVSSNTSLFGPNDEYTLRIGAGATDDPVGNFFFEGAVDEVAIYAKVLTPTQVLTHYALGAKPMTPPTLDIARSAQGIVLTWANGSLQESTALVGGTWTPVQNAVSPMTVQPTGTMKFYRAAR